MSETDTQNLEHKAEREWAIANILQKRRVALDALNDLRQDCQAEMDAIKVDGSLAPDLIPFYGAIIKTLDLLDVEIDPIRALRDHLRLGVIPETFLRDDIKNLTDANGDRVSLTQDTFASILAEDRPQAFTWLRENNHGDIIQETVNVSTLRSFAKTWMMDTGMEFPEESRIKTTLRPAVSFTAGKDSPNKLIRKAATRD